jgi:hypothetical protein
VSPLLLPSGQPTACRAAAAAAAGLLRGLGLRLGELGWQWWLGDEPRLAQQAGHALRGVRANSKPVPAGPAMQSVQEQRERYQWHADAGRVLHWVR